MGYESPGGERYRLPAVFQIYEKLFGFYGPQHWWPGDDSFEIMVGAILTQGTAWRNVEKVISTLKEKNLLNPQRLYSLDRKNLATLIRPAGFYRLKAERLRHFLHFFNENYGGNIESFSTLDTGTLRRELMEIRGIGEETADSILLYALERPVFVVDAYTRRIFSRHGFFALRDSYRCIQRVFEKNLPRDPKLYNEYHALIVALGKEWCKKRPICAGCPLEQYIA